MRHALRFILILAMLAALVVGVGFYGVAKPQVPRFETQGHGQLLMDPRFEVELAAGHALQLPRGLSAADTVHRFLDIYRLAGPRVGSRFVDPADLLTMSGVRGLTAWNGRWPDATAADLKALEAVDRVLIPQGISLHPESDFLTGQGGVQVINLVGVERVTHVSQLPGTLPYRAATGWDPYYAWSDQQIDAYNAHAPVARADRVHYYFGLLLGYPDQAIRGYIGAGAQRNDCAIHSDIPYSSYYECGMPDFDFLPQDVVDPGINATIHDWGSLLHDIYQQPDMQRLAQDPAFIAARRAFLDTAHDETMGWWSDERGRLGMWTPERWESNREIRTSQLTDRHERVLLACSSALAEQTRRGAPTEDLLKLCRHTAEQLGLETGFTDMTLRAWVALGSFETTGPHRNLYDAAAVGHPEWLPKTAQKH